jgi:hypothetical protein
LLDRWLATLVNLELIRFSPFVILTFCSSEFVEFLIGYLPPLAILGPFGRSLMDTCYMFLITVHVCLHDDYILYLQSVDIIGRL